MNSKTLVSPAIAMALLVLGATAGQSAPDETAAAATEQQPLTFFCATDGAAPVTTVRVAPENEPAQVRPVLTWTPEYFPATEATAMACQDAADRLQAYTQQGNPSDMAFTTGEVDGLPAICLEVELGDGCNSESLLASLPADRDANAVLLSMTDEASHPNVVMRGDFPVTIDALPFRLWDLGGLFGNN